MWHDSRAIQLGCPETFGTHKCSQLNGHTGAHYCLCVQGAQKRWFTGQPAPLSAYNPKHLTAHHVRELRERGLVK